LNTLREAHRTAMRAAIRAPRLTRSATWSLGNCYWWIKVEVERHLDEDAARALEADLQALGFVLNSAAGRAPITGDEVVQEATGDGWFARYGTDMALPDDLREVANRRLERLADVLDVPDKETRS
jgi:hypothetical protein